MPPSKFIKVVGYSSEDAKMPASNLLSSKGKWRCKEGGEKQAWVILQLQALANISHVDIGNFGSAFIEVQVGRIGMDQEQFAVLLPSSSFMGPEESRAMTNETRVRMFSSDKLSQSALKEKWNLIKVICSQPFNRHEKYGISFIALTTTEDSILKTHETPAEQPKKLGLFSIKSTDDDDFSVGTYFQKKKEPAAPAATASAELRADRTLASLALQSSAKEEKKLLDLKAKYEKSAEEKKPDRSERELPRRDMLPGERNHVPDDNNEDDISLPHSSKDKDEKNRHSDDKHKHKDNSKEKHRDSHHRRESDKASHSKDKHKDRHDKDKTRYDSGKHDKHKHKDESRNKENRKDRENLTNERSASKDAKRRSSQEAKSTENAPKKFAPFDKLMDGVTFVISGFQNPLRGELRSKACKIGAKYKADWDGSCSHLICAFANTPKYNQVKGKGKIVTKEWIEESYSLRRKLNWKKYSLTKSADEESEEEIFEGSPPEQQQQLQQQPAQTNSQNNGHSSSSRTVDPDEENTDDEIERVMNANKVLFTDNKDKTPSNNGGRSSKSDDYNMDEDTDDEIERAQKKIEQEFKKRREKRKKRESSEGDSSSSKRVKKETPKKKDNHDKSETPKKKDEKDKRNGEKRRSSDAAYEIETDSENSDDAYGAQTDVEDDNIQEVKARLDKLPLTKYPQIFQGKCFMLKGINKEESNLIERYIQCYGGDISMYNSDRVDYILTKSASPADIRDAKCGNSKVEVLEPDWVMKCCDKQQIVSCDKYRC